MTLRTATVVVCIGIHWAVSSREPADAGEELRGLRVAVDSSTLTIGTAKQPILEYRYEPSPRKPYAKGLSTSSGIQLLRDAPLDHLHHHGLMYAFRGNGVDFWGEADGAGRQVHRSLDGIRSWSHGGVSVASFTQKVDWLSADGKNLLREDRTLQVYRDKALPTTSLLTWETRLRPAQGMDSVELSGAHYHGLGMRFVKSMDKDGRFLDATDRPAEPVRGNEKLLRSKWCAYTAVSEGKTVSVAMFDHPKNARHPCRWFIMKDPFSYLSATLNLHRQSMTLRASQTLELRYGVAAWEGPANAGQVEKLYEAWLNYTSMQTPAGSRSE